MNLYKVMVRDFVVYVNAANVAAAEDVAILWAEQIFVPEADKTVQSIELLGRKRGKVWN